MNDNTILRIKVPAHLYESVKKQLTINESKKKLSEAITGTEEELKAFYLKAKQIEAEGTDIDSAIQHALFDVNNPDDAKELSINEAKKSGKAFGDWKVVKEKKLPKDGMKKVEEADKVEETNQIEEKSMEKKPRTLDELKKAKEKLEAKINEMESAPKDKKEENIQEIDDTKYQAAMEVLNSLPIIAQIAKMDPFAAGMALVGMVTGGTIAAPKISSGIDYLMTKIKNPGKKKDLADYAQEKGVDVSGQ